MAQVTGILCQVITSNVDGAGTDGRVYLGLGGREFCLDSGTSDYKRGSWREYVMGLGPVEPELPPPQVRVLNAQQNDPRVGLPIKRLDTPVYIRFEPVDGSAAWNLAFVAVLVYAPQFEVAYAPPEPNNFDSLWLGDKFGKILYLPEYFGEGGIERELLGIGRSRAGIRPGVR